MDQTKTQKYTLKDLANEFGVSKPTVVNILAKNEIGEIEKKGNRKVYGQNAFDAIAKHQTQKNETNKKVEQVVNNASLNVGRKIQVGTQNPSSITKDDLKQFQTAINNIEEMKHSLNRLIELTSERGSTRETDELVTRLIKVFGDRLKENDSLNNFNNAVNELKSLTDSTNLIISNQKEMMTKIDNLNEKVDGLYSKLVKNIHHVNYQKVGNVVADVLEKRQKNNKNAKLHIVD
ncbi:hypothetical protein LRI_2022 (plasmid) [Limosilactobacillus reuteri I5007]|uniref:Uncharacterized protein n=1 Tax=Limosilactobacillus reuteri I5007 TaxID=1340495 RepID=R9WK64_LIMRT|nr:hypothetical protein [Limosilactobacillus reuteri]AGO00232.1 hypothetical protein LRI_2022 [Limosilactobacillus reuteri I5007]